MADGNYPFEHRFITPLREQAAAVAAAAQKAAAQAQAGTGGCCGGKAAEFTKSVVTAAAAAPLKTSFTLRAKATDTGGNSMWSNTLTVNLVADATPPRVVKFLPTAGSFTGTLRTVAATFGEPIDQATLNATSFILAGAGADGVFGTADDFLPTGGTLSYREATNAAFLTFAADLPPSLYRLIVKPPLADLAGNGIAVPAQAQFRVFSFLDSDGDGIPDDVEVLLGLDPHNPDTGGTGVRDGDKDFDHDGLSNAAENAFGLDPRNPYSNGSSVLDGDADPDHDGLRNRREALAGTNPYKADTDGDGWNDETEVTGGSNPLDPKSRPIGLIAAQPTTHIVRLGDLTTGLLANGSVIAQPPVFLARTVSDNGGLGSAAIIATPTVFSARPVSDLSGNGFASLIATPTVYLARYDQPEGSANWLTGSIIAQPPVTIARQTSASDGVGAASITATPPVFTARLASASGGPNGGTGAASFIATPQVNILLLDFTGTFIAIPTVTIQIQNP